MGMLKAGRPSGRTESHVAGAVKKLGEEARLTIRVSKAELKSYKRFALENDTTMSAIVRVALDEYVNKC